MAWRFEGSGTQAQMLAGVAAMTGNGESVETTLLATAISNATNLINQYYALNPGVTTHVLVEGRGRPLSSRNRVIVETVQLDPQGRIIARAWPTTGE